MRVPNPWFQVAGFTLGILDDMFGSKSQEQVTKIVNEDVKEINTNTGFSLPHAGTITVGDLKAAQIGGGGGGIR